jgi:hypothetical protein
MRRLEVFWGVKASGFAFGRSAEQICVEGSMRLTDPSYISEQMFDKMLREKLQDNPDDESVHQQALQLIQMVRRSQARNQIIADIMRAAKASKQTSVEQLAEIGFCMGLQFGFELALSYPPLRSN